MLRSRRQIPRQTNVTMAAVVVDHDMKPIQPADAVLCSGVQQRTEIRAATTPLRAAFRTTIPKTLPLVAPQHIRIAKSRRLLVMK